MSFLDRGIGFMHRIALSKNTVEASTDAELGRNRAVATWLFVCAAMIFVMILLGGATRLTGSGLSIVEWKPLSLLPPLNEEEWLAEFESYKKYPEYLKINSWMEIDSFKDIYWLEYLHRLWGRIIGLVFAVPFFFFWVKGTIRGKLSWLLVGVFVIGGLQGILGWFMVASGLIDNPDVSQYRLAAHLVLAFFLYGCLLWIGLRLLIKDCIEATHPNSYTLAGCALGIAGLTLIVVVSGALVAGLNAGLIYNSFPLMEGRLIPAGLYDLTPWYLNWFENIKTVQFNHRILAIVLLLAICYLWDSVRRAGLEIQSRKLIRALLVVSVLQIFFGILTLLSLVPLPLALIHQATALLVFTFAVWLACNLWPRDSQISRRLQKTS